MSFAYHIMGGGRHIGRFLDIDIRLNRSWFLGAGVLLLLMASSLKTLGLLALPVAVVLVLLLYLSVLAHEYGHALAARHYGIPTTAITLHALGGLAQIASEPQRPKDEIVVAAAGPLVSFALALGGLMMAFPLEVVAPPIAVVAWWFGSMNALLGVFNLLPGMPLDGGRILRGILWARKGDRDAASLTASSWGVRVGQGLMVVGVLGALGLLPLGGFSMALIGYFVYSAASSEKRRLESKQRGRPDLGSLFRTFTTMTRGVPRTPYDDDVEEVVRYPDGREVIIRKSRR